MHQGGDLQTGYCTNKIGTHLGPKKKQTIRMPGNSMFAMGVELDLKNIPTMDLTYQYYKRPR